MSHGLLWFPLLLAFVLLRRLDGWNGGAKTCFAPGPKAPNSPSSMVVVVPV